MYLRRLTIASPGVISRMPVPFRQPNFELINRKSFVLLGGEQGSFQRNHNFGTNP